MYDYAVASPPGSGKRSRLDLERARTLHGAQTYGLLVERDCAALLAWLGDKPAARLAPDCLQEFARTHDWTPGYLRGIVEQVRGAIRLAAAETVDQARARLAAVSTDLREEARAFGDFGPAVAAMRLESDLLIPKQSTKTVTSVSIVARIQQAEQRAGLVTVQADQVVTTVETGPDPEPEQLEPEPAPVVVAARLAPPGESPGPSRMEVEQLAAPCDPGEG
jgi:hypothetical protein